MPHIQVHGSHVGKDHHMTTALIESLHTIPNFVVWKMETRNGKPSKIPYQPHHPQRMARSGDPRTWSTYEQAIFVQKNAYFDGIGFEVYPKTDQLYDRYYADGISHKFWRDLTTQEIDAFKKNITDKDGYSLIMIDIDHCISGGRLSDKARKIVEIADSYTEFSPSGTGLHIFVYGTIPAIGNRHNGIEMYQDTRYLTVTNKPLTGYNRCIKLNPEGISRIHSEFIKRPKLDSTPTGSYELRSDAGVVLLAKCAANGDKFKKLLKGDTSGYVVPEQFSNAGAADRSGPDLALCRILAYWTQDADQIDRIFRRSGLYLKDTRWEGRPKWDRDDYRVRTLRVALGESL